MEIAIVGRWELMIVTGLVLRFVERPAGLVRRWFMKVRLFVARVMLPIREATQPSDLAGTNVIIVAGMPGFEAVAALPLLSVRAQFVIEGEGTVNITLMAVGG